jgi:hypothetical protein
MSDFSKATPRPWKQHGTSIYFPRTAGGFDLRHCPEPEANAALIVEAVNSYDANKALIAELVALVTDLSSDLEDEINARYGGSEEHPALVRKYQNDMEICWRARAALAKAKAVTG